MKEENKDYTDLSEGVSFDKLLKLRDVAIDNRSDKHKEYLEACDRVTEIYLEISKRRRK